MRALNGWFLKSERRNIIVEARRFWKHPLSAPPTLAGWNAVLGLAGCRIPEGKPASPSTVKLASDRSIYYGFNVS